jgi:hypothetical protein
MLPNTPLCFFTIVIALSKLILFFSGYALQDFSLLRG